MAQPFTGPLTVFDETGAPVSGALIYTYQAGTTVSKAVYTTPALSVAESNPVVADTGGKATFYLGAGAYRIEVRTPDGVVIPAYSVDQQTAAESGSGTLTTLVEKYTATASQTAFPTAGNFVVATNAVAVYLNGLRLHLTDDFLETNTALITTTFPCVAGWELTFEIQS